MVRILDLTSRYNHNERRGGENEDRRGKSREAKKEYAKDDFLLLRGMNTLMPSLEKRDFRNFSQHSVAQRRNADINHMLI